MRTAWVIGATVGLFAIAGIVGGAVTQTSNEHDSEERLFEGLAHSSEGTRVVVETSIDDLLPNTLYHFRSSDSEKPQPLGAGLVIGRISEPAEIAAYTYGAGEDAEMKTRVSDDGDAQWRVVAFRLTVDEGLMSFPAGTELNVGLVVSGGLSSAEAIEGLKALDRVVVALGDPGFFDADPDLYSIRNDGALLGKVTEEGTITFPAMDHQDSRALVGSLNTPDKLSEAARRPARVIKFDDVSGMPLADPVSVEEWERGD